MPKDGAAGGGSIAKDSITAAVIDRIRALADGNGATAADVVVRAASREDRPVNLRLTIGIDWSSTRTNRYGRIRPDGATPCNGFSEMEALMRQQCGAAANDPAAAEALKAALARDPVGAFRTWQDGFKVRDLPLRYYYWEACQQCHGEAQVRCDNMWCSFGKVQCSSCSGTGKSVCSRCSGTRQISQQRMVWGEKGYVTEWGMVSCPTCGGEGRHGGCAAGCYGTGRVDCPRCGGTTKVPCEACGRTGHFTRVFDAWLKGDVARSWAFYTGQSDSFKAAVKAISITDLPGGHADAAVLGLEAAAGAVSATYKCTVPHVVADLACQRVGIHVEAVGKQGFVAAMPPFLDELIAGARTEITLARSAAAVVQAARSTRVTRDLLGAVCGSTRDVDANAIAARYGGAVSPWVVVALHQSLADTYDQVGQRSVLRVWRLALPLLVAWGALAHLYHLPEEAYLALNLPFSPWLYWPFEAGVALAPVWAARALAGRRGRAAVRQIVGAGALRWPRQGRWPLGATALVLAAHLAAWQSPHDARALGLPPLPWEDSTEDDPPPRKTTAPAATPAAPANRAAPAKDHLEPSRKPKLEATALPPDAPTKGNPDVYRVQHPLAQLGFYDGAVDGTAGTRTQGAVEALLARVPDGPAMDRYKGKGIANLAHAALRDEFRLASDADRTPAAALSNLARAQLSKDDLARLDAAVDQAAATPGAERAWRSADGRRGGRVLVARDDGSRGGDRCVRLEAEVEIGGAVEAAKPQTVCRSGGRWAPR